MNKSNYPVSIVEADKINKKNLSFIRDYVTVKKHQNNNNMCFGNYKPISKLFNL